MHRKLIQQNQPSDFLQRNQLIALLATEGICLVIVILFGWNVLFGLYFIFALAVAIISVFQIRRWTESKTGSDWQNRQLTLASVGAFEQDRFKKTQMLAFSILEHMGYALLIPFNSIDMLQAIRHQVEKKRSIDEYVARATAYPRLNQPLILISIQVVIFLFLSQFITPTDGLRAIVTIIVIGIIMRYSRAFVRPGMVISIFRQSQQSILLGFAIHTAWVGLALLLSLSALGIWTGAYSSLPEAAVRLIQGILSFDFLAGFLQSRGDPFRFLVMAATALFITGFVSAFGFGLLRQIHPTVQERATGSLMLFQIGNFDRAIEQISSIPSTERVLASDLVLSVVTAAKGDAQKAIDVAHRVAQRELGDTVDGVLGKILADLTNNVYVKNEVIEQFLQVWLGSNPDDAAFADAIMAGLVSKDRQITINIPSSMPLSEIAYFLSVGDLPGARAKLKEYSFENARPYSVFVFMMCYTFYFIQHLENPQLLESDKAAITDVLKTYLVRLLNAADLLIAEIELNRALMLITAWSIIYNSFQLRKQAIETCLRLRDRARVDHPLTMSTYVLIDNALRSWQSGRGN